MRQRSAGDAGGPLGVTPAELLRLCQAAGGPVDALVPFAGNLVPLETSHTHLLNAACWSRLTVLSVNVEGMRHSVPADLVRGLGAQSAASVEQVCQHTLFVCSQPESFLRRWQADRGDAWMSDKATGAVRDRRGRAGSFKQQLETCYTMLCTSEPAPLQSLVQDAPIVLLQVTALYRRPMSLRDPPLPILSECPLMVMHRLRCCRPRTATAHSSLCRRQSCSPTTTHSRRRRRRLRTRCAMPTRASAT